MMAATRRGCESTATACISSSPCSEHDADRHGRREQSLQEADEHVATGAGLGERGRADRKVRDDIDVEVSQVVGGPKP